MPKQPSDPSEGGGAPSSDEAPSFATDIAPLFTDEDRGCMITHSRDNDWDPVLDFREYESVKAWSQDIYSVVRSGLMPKDPLEPRWTDEMIALFRSWLDAGCPP